MKTEKQPLWDQLLALLQEDLDWYHYPETELYQQITTVGRNVFQEKKEPGSGRIDEETYLLLNEQGYKNHEIAEKMNVSLQVLYLWRREKGYIKKKKMEETQ